MKGFFDDIAVGFWVQGVGDFGHKESLKVPNITHVGPITIYTIL